jgi:hypothetical protein
LKLEDGKIRVVFLPKNMTTLIQPIYEGITQGCKACYHSELVAAAVNELEVTELLTSDGTYSVCLVWREVNTKELKTTRKKCV